VNSANTGADGSPQALLDGFQAAIVVSVIAASLGVALTAVRGRRPVLAAEPVVEVEPVAEAPEAEAA
jgi:hypothetical protein